MRIERLREEREGDRYIALADVVWEDVDHPTRTLRIETSDGLAAEMEPSADAFAVAMLPLGQWMGERRVRIDGRVCCRLRDGLAAAGELFATSFARAVPVVEPTLGFAPTIPRSTPRAASFLSGGIDALALLRANRLDYPRDHPGSIRDCLLLFGLNTYDFDERGPAPERVAAFEAHAARLAAFAARADAELLSLHTNVRTFYPDFEIWTHVGFGAGMLSVALCLGRRLDRVLLASAGVGMRQPLQGSHPWLDHHYSTEAVGIHHAQAAMPRFEKTRLVADWDDALAVLRSCVYATVPPHGRINCGECDKCLRTMLALVALDRLDRATTFPFDDVTPAMLEPLRIESPLAAMYHGQCAAALAERGRHDLARPLRAKIAAWERLERRRRRGEAVRRFVGLR